MWIVLLKDLVPTKMKLQAGSLTDALWCSKPGQEEHSPHQATEQAHLALTSVCPHQALPAPVSRGHYGSQKRTMRGVLWPGQQGPGVCSSDLIWEQQQKARLSMKQGCKPQCIFSCSIRLLTKHKFKDRLVKNLNTEATPSTGLFWTGSPKYCTDHTHRPCTCLDTEDYNYLTPPTDSC